MYPLPLFMKNKEMKKISFRGIPIKCFETPKPMNEAVNRKLWVLENFKTKHGRLPIKEERAFSTLTELGDVFSKGLRRNVTEGLYKRYLGVIRDV